MDARRAVGRAKEELGQGREGGSFVRGWAPTIASVVGRGEGDAVAFRTTSCSKCRCGNGDQSDAGHRQLAGRVDEIWKWGAGACEDEPMLDLPHAKENQVGRWRRQEIGHARIWPKLHAKKNPNLANLFS